MSVHVQTPGAQYMSDLIPPWEAVKAFANSAFTTSLLGSLAGAFGGAYAAQRIAKRVKVREELLAEVRYVNTAIAIAFEIVNALLALKRQHVRSMIERHEEEYKRLLEYKAKRDAGFIQGNTQYHFQADFKTLEPLSAPIAQLLELILSKLSTTGRPLNLAMSLSAIAERFNGMVSRRNALIAELREGKMPHGAELHHMYFGLPFGGGHVSQEYPDALRGIASYLDDLIFFSNLLCRDLKEHGESLVERFRAEVGGVPPNISEVNFDTPEAKGLIPAESEYASILSAFQKRPQVSKHWWQR